MMNAGEKQSENSIAATCPGCGQTERWCRCQPPDDDDGVWVDENGPVDAAATLPFSDEASLRAALATARPGDRLVYFGDGPIVLGNDGCVEEVKP